MIYGLPAKIAEAIKHEIDSQTFSRQFETNLIVVPKLDIKLQPDSKVKINIIPRGVSQKELTRNHCQNVYTIDIGFTQQCQVKLEDVNALCEFTEEVMRFLRKRQLTQCPGAHWIHSDLNPIYDPDALAQRKMFFSLLSLEYLYYIADE